MESPVQASERLLQALAVTTELTATDLSNAAKRAMIDDLALYPEPQVLAALTRCRRELRGRLTVADIVARLEDGRPGPEEAWAMMPQNEAQTVVWSDEMSRAWSVAASLMAAGDEVAARMAFRESYVRELAEARAQHRPVRWSASLGHDPRAREAALIDAIDRGRIEIGYAKNLLPCRNDLSSQMKALLEKSLTIMVALPEKIEADDDGEREETQRRAQLGAPDHRAP